MTDVKFVVIGVVAGYVILSVLNDDRTTTLERRHPPKFPYQDHRVAHQQSWREQWVDELNEIEHYLGIPKTYRVKTNGTKVPVYDHHMGRRTLSTHEAKKSNGY